MNRLGSQYYDALNKVKEQLFQDTNKYICERCGDIMVQDDACIIYICPKCLYSTYLKKEK